MSETDELLKVFSEWSEREEELWIELYQDFIAQLIGARLDPESPQRVKLQDYQQRYDTLTEDLLMAAELADRAIQELHVRFDIQKQHEEKRKRGTRTANQVKRQRRLDSRK